MQEDDRDATPFELLEQEHLIRVAPGQPVGFASHVITPSRGLCLVDEDKLAASDLDLADLSVVADAVSTPFQALVNANLRAGDVAIFVGVGGVGAFGAQLANAMGAHVAAIDIDEERLERVAPYGVERTIRSGDDPRAIKASLRVWAKEQGYPSTGWKIFETSGHPGGQALAYSLLGYDAHLGVVGYTRAKIEVRLSNLMAFDATVRGTWGCLPEHYPAVLEYVLNGDVELRRFVERRPMSQINETFEALRSHTLKLRPVLVPDFDGAKT